MLTKNVPFEEVYDILALRIIFDVNDEKEEKIQKKVSDTEKTLGISLDELQRRAVIQAVRSGIFILTGGPGTGKTTTINAIIHYFEKEELHLKVLRNLFLLLLFS